MMPVYFNRDPIHKRFIMLTHTCGEEFNTETFLLHHRVVEYIRKIFEEAQIITEYRPEPAGWVWIETTVKLNNDADEAYFLLLTSNGIKI